MYARTTEQDRRAQVQALAEEIYRERYDYLLRIAVKHAANREDAEEAVQFSFSALIEKYDPAAGSPPLAWLTLYADPRVMPTQFRNPAWQADHVLERSA